MQTSIDTSVAKQYQRWLDADAAARKNWDKADRELKKLVRAVKLGRKASKVVPISESRGVEITNQFRESDKVFTPAFCKKFKVKEVALSAD